MITTTEAIDLVAQERDKQKGFTDGALTETNDLIACALAYLGRAATGVFRNEREELDRREMLVKATAVLVDAIERG